MIGLGPAGARETRAGAARPKTTSGANRVAGGVKTDALQIPLRRLVAVAAMIGEREARLQKPAAERMVDGPGANAEEDES